MRWVCLVFPLAGCTMTTGPVIVAGHDAATDAVAVQDGAADAGDPTCVVPVHFALNSVGGNIYCTPLGFDTVTVDVMANGGRADAVTITFHDTDTMLSDRVVSVAQPEIGACRLDTLEAIPGPTGLGTSSCELRVSVACNNVLNVSGSLLRQDATATWLPHGGIAGVGTSCSWESTNAGDGWSLTLQ